MNIIAFDRVFLPAWRCYRPMPNKLKFRKRAFRKVCPAGIYNMLSLISQLAINYIREEETIMELVNVENMSIDQLKEYAATLDWSKVPEYNHIDWDNDDLLVIRSKIKAAIDNITEKGE